MPYFGIPIRNGLPIGLGSVVGFGVPQFSPASLFTAGEQGAWYDPSDYGPTGTLFQDPAGTIPVTAVEQAVGLMLDKSKGLALLGSNLFTGTASGGAFGNAGPTTYANNVITSVGNPNNGRTSRLIVTGNKSYKVVFNQQAVPSGGTWDISVSWSADGTTLSGFLISSIPISSTSFIFTTPATAIRVEVTITRQGASSPGATDTCTFAGMTVFELAGNHATAYNSGAARPILRARYNLLTYSEEFDNGAWTKFNCTASTVASNITVAPDGAATAFKLVVNNGSQSTPAMTQSLSLTIGTTYTTSFFVKKAERQYVRFGFFYDSGSYAAAEFNLDTGSMGRVAAAGTNYSVASTSAASVGNGWYKITLTGTVGHATAFFSAIGWATAWTSGFPDANQTGDGTSGIFIWGADLRTAVDAALNIPAYQAITTATSYDTSGFPVYIDADGSDDGMSTASIDFTGTDKMTVFAGVTKLQDASQRVVAELSADIASNNGTFLLAAPDGATQTFGWDSKGTSQVDAVATSQPSPVNAVVTGIGDIGADVCTIRVNGAQADTDTGDQGTGNYGNYPLYLFSRNNASLRFRGRVYSLIIRGASTTTPTIQATESWVAGKMKLPL